MKSKIKHISFLYGNLICFEREKTIDSSQLNNLPCARKWLQGYTYLQERKKGERRKKVVGGAWGLYLMEKIASLNLPSSSFYNCKGGNMVDNVLPSYKQSVASLLEKKNIDSWQK